MARFMVVHPDNTVSLVFADRIRTDAAHGLEVLREGKWEHLYSRSLWKHVRDHNDFYLFLEGQLAPGGRESWLVEQPNPEPERADVEDAAEDEAPLVAPEVGSGEPSPQAVPQTTPFVPPPGTYLYTVWGDDHNGMAAAIVAADVELRERGEAIDLIFTDPIGDVVAFFRDGTYANVFRLAGGDLDARMQAAIVGKAWVLA